MKKIILFITLILTANAVSAQRSTHQFQFDKLFIQGKEMFLSGNYVGAQDFLSKYLTESNDKFLCEEAKYMWAVCTFHRGEKKSGDVLKNFLEDHPESVHKDQIRFLIGSYYFDKREWNLAKFWFNQSNLDYLTPHTQEDYSFRAAYSHLQLGDKKEAQRYFGLLYQNSRKYHDAANYYLGYIDYINNEYDLALTRFNRLKNHPEYREAVSFYTAQATFFKGDMKNAIRLSESFVQVFHRSEYKTEVYRILGNAYYRLGQPSKALPFYENYLAKTDKPLRGDAYFMGLSYAETGKYSDAIRMFQHAIDTHDALTQNAQLQLGHIYLKTEKKQQAQMAFEAASRHNSDPKVRETAMFNYALLVHETNFSVFSESIALFENFLTHYPTSQYANQVNDILAETFLSTKNYDAALKAINRISKPAQRILKAKQMILFQLGAQQFINRNLNEAINYFNQSIGMGNYNSNAHDNAHYWRGESRYRLGNYTKAETDFAIFTQKASPKVENYASGWYSLGYSRFKQHQYNEALRAFQRYISVETNKHCPQFADAYNRIGDLYYYNRDFAQAENYYAQAATTNPSVADYAAYQKAFVMGLQRNYQGKIAALDDLMRRYPNSIYFDDALYEKSRTLTTIHRESEAIKVLQQLIADYPKSALASQAGIQLGQLYFNTENYFQSINAYKNVIKNFPGSDDAKTALVSLETVYREKNDVQSYVDYANSLPGGMRISVSRQDSLTYLAAENIYIRGPKASAKKALTRYLQSYPSGTYSSDANYYLGVISDEKGNTSQALFHFRKVVDANDTKFIEQALLYVAKAEYAAGNYRMALADYSQLTNVARAITNRQTGQLGIVRAQSKLGSYHEAVRAATNLLENKNLSPEIVAETRYLRGKAYQQIKEADKAILDFQAIARDTRNIYGAEAQFILADTYYRWKSYDKAEAQATAFMQKGTPHSYWLARTLIVLSDVYAAKGDSFQAKQYLESLKTNYKGKEEDIQEMIEERLRNNK